jgi:GNAT superfamily N-acetyltransferase
MWQQGFLEMGPLMYAQLRKNPIGIVASSVIVGALVYYKHNLLATVFGTLAALFYVPMTGASFFNALLWRGILHQTQKDMTEDTLQDKWQKEGSSQFFVAEREGILLGCVAIKAVHTLHSERKPGVETLLNEASVWRLSVAKEARKCGVGKLLMQAAEQWAAQNGCKCVSLITGNSESKRFYERLNYNAESYDRAARVIFGGVDKITTADFIKSLLLRRRVDGREHTIFCKAILP